MILSPGLLSDARILAAYLIFFGSYFVFAVGKFPRMKIDRPGAAIIGAVLMVALRIVGAQEALQAIDFATIVLLFSMMLVVANLRVGFFEPVAEWIIERLRPHHLLPTVIFTSGLLSAFLVNDIVCLVITPFVLHLTARLRLPPLPYVLAVATASNIGSAATITGNPQNMLIGSVSGITYLDFIGHLGPVAVAGLFLDWALLHRLYLRGDVDRVTVAQALAAPQFRHDRMRKKPAVVPVIVASSRGLRSAHCRPVQPGQQRAGRDAAAHACGQLPRSSWRLGGAGDGFDARRQPDDYRLGRQHHRRRTGGSGRRARRVSRVLPDWPPVDRGNAGAGIWLVVALAATRHPRRAAAAPPRVTRPGVAARLARFRHGPESPRLLSSVRVERIDEAANAVLGSRDSDNDLVLDDEWCNCGRVALGVVVDLDVEQDVSGPGVERQEMGVERRHVEAVAADGEAAVDAPAANVQPLWQLAPVMPDLAAGSRVERPCVVVGAGQVHDAVDDERRGFEPPGHAGLKHPLHGEPSDVGRCDLRQRTVSLGALVAGVGSPVVWVTLLLGHDGRRASGCHAGEHDTR